MTKLEAALTYASWGWSVLPVVPNGKIPATRHGVNDATTDKATIERWWQENPDYNIGVAAGEKSGIAVFDIDPRNGGDTSWQQFQQEHGNIPDTIQALTAGGGEHYVVQYNPQLRSCKFREGIDFLSDGRYFLVHPSNIEGRSYEWEGSSDPFDGIAPVSIPQQYLPTFEQSKKTSKTVGQLIQGNRNDGLASLGGAMRSYGMTEAEILAALSIANETRCEIPLPASEVAQIARSVSRYDPENDVAANVALGSQIAESLLAKPQNNEYFLTRASSFLGQPSPIPWVIKGWMPAYATMMIYGESGIGKTFVALDMACHIATGKQWGKFRTKAGMVVYLAGEGNYGLRQRISAWAKANNHTDLENLLVSNKAIDLDAPDAAAQVISAIRELTTEDIVFLVIDTLNNHMSGDENSARDTRSMINACNVISSATGATVGFVHHVAHSADSKHRARGSSAWRGALDTSVLVAYENDETIKVTCTKMKDAQEPEDIFGEIQAVDLGWVDEDGEPLTGAVFVQKDHTPTQKTKDNPILKHQKMFEKAWFDSGAEVIDGKPYLSRSAFMDYLTTKMDMKESSADQYAKGSTKGKPIYELLLAGVIEKHSHGWLVVDNLLSSAFLLSKNEEKLP
jgi:hypothetical protein